MCHPKFHVLESNLHCGGTGMMETLREGTWWKMISGDTALERINIVLKGAWLVLKRVGYYRKHKSGLSILFAFHLAM